MLLCDLRLARTEQSVIRRFPEGDARGDVAVAGAVHTGSGICPWYTPWLTNP